MPKDWDKQQRTAPVGVPRQELPSLQCIGDADERLYLRFRLRSNIATDQEVARARCEQWGIDYNVAREEARQCT